MLGEFRYGGRIYYVPKFDAQLARYLPITRVSLSLKTPLLVLGHHIVISPDRKANGNVARDRVGSFWVSKEAYEAYLAYRSQPVWRRASYWLGSASRKGKKQILNLWGGFVPSWFQQ